MCGESLTADFTVSINGQDSLRKGTNSAWFLTGWLLKPLLRERCGQALPAWFLICAIRGISMTTKPWLPVCLQARVARKYKSTTNSKHDLPVVPNLLAQDFSASASEQKWVSVSLIFGPMNAGCIWL